MASDKTDEKLCLIPSAPFCYFDALVNCVVDLEIKFLVLFTFKFWSYKFLKVLYVLEDVTTSSFNAYSFK